MKKIYCIVVTYNGIQWIKKCLMSLSESSYPIQVIVIDNGSTDLTVSVVKNLFPLVRLIESERNLGFGQANNIGLKIAIEDEADHVFLLNQDAWIETGTIAELLQTQTENPEYGILSPIHLTGAGTDMDANFAGYFINSEIKCFLRSSILDKNSLPLIVPAPFVNAAAWLISAACLKKTGGFDPIFFHYGEDRNYTQRALSMGFKIGIHTRTKIYHDREQRMPGKTPDFQKKLKEDRIHFLNQVCDPRESNYKTIIKRRLLRYTFLLSRDLLSFNKPGAAYHCGMVKMILGSLRGIHRSRKISTMSSCIPHLAEEQ